MTLQIKIRTQINERYQNHSESTGDPMRPLFVLLEGSGTDDIWGPSLMIAQDCGPLRHHTRTNVGVRASSKGYFVQIYQ